MVARYKYVEYPYLGCLVWGRSLAQQVSTCVSIVELKVVPVPFHGRDEVAPHLPVDDVDVSCPRLPSRELIVLCWGKVCFGVCVVCVSVAASERWWCVNRRLNVPQSLVLSTTSPDGTQHGFWIVSLFRR